MTKGSFAYFSKNIRTILGIVLIWRGIWYMLDILDRFVFGEKHLPTAVAGIIIGFLLLYLPDRDLKEIEKL